MQALVVIASPSDFEKWQVAEVKADVELAAARADLPVAVSCFCATGKAA